METVAAKASEILLFCLFVVLCLGLFGWFGLVFFFCVCFDHRLQLLY